jgi:hypothetical protein
MTMLATSLAPAMPVMDDETSELQWDAEVGALRLPGGSVVDLRHRVPLRRIVSALVRHLRAAPGTPVNARELVAAGWPGERLLPCAATNRLYVALATLRSLGMRGCLRRGRGGWLLDPALRLVSGDARVLRPVSEPACAW